MKKFWWGSTFEVPPISPLIQGDAPVCCWLLAWRLPKWFRSNLPVPRECYWSDWWSSDCFLRILSKWASEGGRWSNPGSSQSAHLHCDDSAQLGMFRCSARACSNFPTALSSWSSCTPQAPSYGSISWRPLASSRYSALCDYTNQI